MITSKEAGQAASAVFDAALTRAVNKIFKPGHEALADALARIQELQTENEGLKSENESLKRKLKVTQDILSNIARAAL